MGDSYTIIGGGPAGAAAAVAFRRLGYEVTVYEYSRRLASKPCGYGIPDLNDLPFPLPRASLGLKVKSVKLYVDGHLAVEMDSIIDGYIVDKREMLEALILESGAELRLGARYNPSINKIKDGGKVVDPGKAVLAAGSAFYRGEKINAVETHVRANGDIPSDGMEIYFDTRLLGYYWVFPSLKADAQVGVGGYESPHRLRELLIRFIDRDPRISSITEDVIGAPIAVGGLDVRWMREGMITVGEAAGFVLPLTGEGIRPSMISGYTAASILARNGDPINHLRRLRISKAIEIHRRILDRVKTMDPRRRRRFLLEIPASVHLEVSLGLMRKRNIIKALAGKPMLALKLLRLMGGGTG